MPRRTGSRPTLGELERAVLEVLWARERATVREVHDSLAADRTIAYTTVMTVLDRMYAKGIVGRDKDARAWRYHASASRGAMTADLMRDALEEFSDTDRQAALVAFVGDASTTDREALRRALAALDAATD